MHDKYCLVEQFWHIVIRYVTCCLVRSNMQWITTPSDMDHTNSTAHHPALSDPALPVFSVPCPHARANQINGVFCSLVIITDGTFGSPGPDPGQDSVDSFLSLVPVRIQYQPE